MSKKSNGQKRRNLILIKINSAFEKPLILLSFVWIGLVIFELVYGLQQGIEIFIYILWIIFIVDFFLEISIAPDKKRYLKENSISALALFIPALRVFRLFRFTKGLKAVRLLRTLNLAQILASLNRSIKTIKLAIRGRGIEYLALLTVIIVFSGSAGIYYFENVTELIKNGYEVPGAARINSFGDALWFTSMIIVTIGSDYWPKTPEGRVLTFILSLYAFAVFGYITATIASIILGKKVR